MNELKPCPFCGNNDIKFLQVSDDNIKGFYCCWDCGALTGKRDSLINIAAKDWNTRPAPTLEIPISGVYLSPQELDKENKKLDKLYNEKTTPAPPPRREGEGEGMSQLDDDYCDLCGKVHPNEGSCGMNGEKEIEELKPYRCCDEMLKCQICGKEHYCINSPKPEIPSVEEIEKIIMAQHSGISFMYANIIAQAIHRAMREKGTKCIH